MSTAVDARVECGGGRGADFDLILRDRHRVDEPESRLEIREQRIDELETHLAERSRIEDKIENLPNKIRDDRSYREQRQRLLDQASLPQRLKWKVTGVLVDDDRTTVTNDSSTP